MDSLLQRGDRVPHFTVTRRDGSPVNYVDTTWQRRNLLLVVVPTGPAAQQGWDEYAARIAERGREWAEYETDVVITADTVPGVPSPGVVVADRWGEIQGVWHDTSSDRLPSAAELVDWVGYVQRVCPECQGEAL